MDTQILDMVKVKVSGDGLRAVAFLDAYEGVTPDADMVRQCLEQAGVRFGILEEGIRNLLVSPAVETVVAEGLPAVPGKSGWVERLVPIPVPDPELQAANSLVKQSLLLWNVRTGEQVARVYPPEPGVEGTNVRGTPIHPKEGKKVIARLGKGVHWSPDDPGLVLAGCDGNAVVDSDGIIDVHEVVELPNGLDYSIGNVDFVGSLVIRGDVASDLIVKAARNIRVHGDVGDARMEAGGDVIVDKGFLGRGTGKITAGGSVSVQHVLNQVIEARQNVQILRESVNGTVSAGKAILAQQAVVTGGFLDAEELIEVGSLGISEGSQAKVRVGRRGKIMERLSCVEKEMHQADKNLAEVKDAVYKLVRMKIDAGQLSPEREQLLQRLQETQRLLPGRLETLKAEREALTAALHGTGEARLVVHGTIHDNVFIDINGARKMNDNAVTGVVFVERNGAVEASGL